jgi:hypothetical protein
MVQEVFPYTLHFSGLQHFNALEGEKFQYKLAKAKVDNILREFLNCLYFFASH